jgi:hypothetical protein
MDETELSVWQKKPADLTVSEQLKVGVGATIVVAAAMVVVPLAIGGVMSLVEKIRTERRIKKEVKTFESTSI